MEIEFKKSYNDILASSGGQVSLNYLMKILKRAFLGPDQSGEETLEEQPGRNESTPEPGPQPAMKS